jgi:hypothetical protein
MTPSSPHSVTMGTGERRIRAMEDLRLAGHDMIGPSVVEDQSNCAMILEASPPPDRKGCFSADGSCKALPRRTEP